MRATIVEDYGILNTISTVDTAKEVRKALKVSFPGVKFSVRARAYSSMAVSWIDGPTEFEVEKVTRNFVGIIGERSLCGDYGVSESYVDNGSGSHYDLKIILHWRSMSEEAVESATREIIKLSEMTDAEFHKVWNGEAVSDWRAVESVLSKVENAYARFPSQQGRGWGDLPASKFRAENLVRLAIMVAMVKTYNA